LLRVNSHQQPGGLRLLEEVFQKALKRIKPRSTSDIFLKARRVTEFGVEVLMT